MLPSATEVKVLLKPSRFAQRADISRSLVYKLIQQGILPSVRISGSRTGGLRIPATALESLLKRAEVAHVVTSDSSSAGDD